MQNDYIDLIEPTPKIYSKKCKLISFILRISLQFSTFAITAAAWYIYDYFIAMFALILSFIIVGIIRSKLRNSVIPVNQREYQYTDKAIADWYVAKELCYADNEDAKDIALNNNTNNIES